MFTYLILRFCVPCPLSALFTHFSFSCFLVPYFALWHPFTRAELSGVSFNGRSGGGGAHRRAWADLQQARDDAAGPARNGRKVWNFKVTISAHTCYPSETEQGERKGGSGRGGGSLLRCLAITKGHVCHRHNASPRDGTLFLLQTQTLLTFGLARMPALKHTPIRDEGILSTSPAIIYLTTVATPPLSLRYLVFFWFRSPRHNTASTTTSKTPGRA